VHPRDSWPRLSRLGCCQLVTKGLWIFVWMFFWIMIWTGRGGVDVWNLSCRRTLERKDIRIEEDKKPCQPKNLKKNKCFCLFASCFYPDTFLHWVLFLLFMGGALLLSLLIGEGELGMCGSVVHKKRGIRKFLKIWTRMMWIYVWGDRNVVRLHFSWSNISHPSANKFF